MRFLLLTGMSGAGKTSAMRYLEDLGVFCVDNLPPMMMLKFMEACQNSGLTCPAVAFAVDVRGGSFFDADAVVKLLMEVRPLGYQIQTIFLDSSDEVLVNRFKETRREHPLAGDYATLEQTIEAERNMLTPLKESASYVIDTTGMKPRTLQSKMRRIVTGDEKNENTIRIQVMSFGFKRGLPREADLVYDVRFLPNPFYIPELCRHSGMDSDVRDFVMNHPVTKEFMERITGLLSFLIPHYQEEGKHRLVIAIGCTGGAHRSVAITEAIAAYLREKEYAVDVMHRDVDVEQAHWLTDN